MSIIGQLSRFLSFPYWILAVFFSPSLALGFPVLLGDNYQVTFQFEGESSQTYNSITNWGIGSNFGAGTATPFERFWTFNSQAGDVAWRTFSSNLAGGFGTVNIPNSHAGIRAQLEHDTATYVDITVTGLDAWRDFPSLANILGVIVDPNSAEHLPGFNLTNIVVGTTSFSFRAPIAPSGSNEFTIGLCRDSSNPSRTEIGGRWRWELSKPS